jgi:DNA-binding Lrp family transcriptional regulator
MKTLELRLISELMKNSHVSDRKLAKRLGTSQPTVSRLRSRLEKEGYIKEYTIIPDFNKLGYQMMAITFVRLRATLTNKVVEEARKVAAESLKTGPYEIIMLERGIGCASHGVVISYHRNYSSYKRLRKWLEHFAFLDVDRIDSFLIDLNDKVRYRPITFKALAQHLLTTEKEKE